MKNSQRKLLSGTMIYFVGNALVQLMSLLMLRFITASVSTEDYGYYNLILTISNLVTPILTLQISDALFKFFIEADSEEKKKEYFSVSVSIVVFSIFLINLGTILIDFFIFDISNAALVALYMISTNIFVLYQKVTRSMGKNIVYVQSNLIKTAIYIVLLFLFICGFGLGVESLFLATIISNIVCIVLIEIRTKSIKYFSIRCLKKSVFKHMIGFSLPLVPNAIFWWFTSSINAMIVSFKMGLDVNGIYTVSNKFSSVLSLVINVFIMAWQESVITEYHDKDFKKFFSQTFSMFTTFVLSVIAVLIPLMYVVFPYMIDESYYESIKYAPILLVASGLSALSSFLSQVFIAQGKTKKILATSIVGVVVNILCVALLINTMGLWAAVIGTLLAHFFIMLVRLIMNRKEFVGLGWIDITKLLVVIFGVLIGIYIYLELNRIHNVIGLIVMFGVAIGININLIKSILQLILERLRRKSD